MTTFLKVENKIDLAIGKIEYDNEVAGIVYINGVDALRMCGMISIE